MPKDSKVLNKMRQFVYKRKSHASTVSWNANNGPGLRWIATLVMYKVNAQSKQMSPRNDCT